VRSSHSRQTARQRVVEDSKKEGLVGTKDADVIGLAVSGETILHTALFGLVFRNGREVEQQIGSGRLRDGVRRREHASVFELTAAHFARHNTLVLAVVLTRRTAPTGIARAQFALGITKAVRATIILASICKRHVHARGRGERQATHTSRET
jgi:hypothetical protein